MVAAIRTGKAKYWVFCGIYATLSLIFGVTFLTFGATFAAAPDGSPAIVLFNIGLVLTWLGATIHAAILNREYLRTLAYKNA